MWALQPVEARALVSPGTFQPLRATLSLTYHLGSCLIAGCRREYFTIRPCNIEPPACAVPNERVPADSAASLEACEPPSCPIWSPSYRSLARTAIEILRPQRQRYYCEANSLIDSSFTETAASGSHIARCNSCQHPRCSLQQPGYSRQLWPTTSSSLPTAESASTSNCTRMTR